MYQPDLFFIKLAVAPMMMIMVSVAARKWGGFVGGVLSGLPLTSAPIILFLTIEQGPVFAGQAASAALSGLTAVLLTYFFYVCITQVASIFIGCLTSAAVFVLCSLLTLHDFFSTWAIAANLALIAIIIWRTEGRRVKAAPLAPPPLWDIPLRVFASTSLLLIITGLAKTLGPHWSGILSPVPVVAWPLVIFLHKRSGRKEMIAAVRGNAFSAIGIIAFYVVVRGLLLRLGLTTAFVLAVATSIVATLGLIKVLRIIRSPASPP